MIRIVSRTEPTRFGENLLRGGAVFAALAASSLVMLFLGYNPLEVYGRMISGSLGTAYRFRETINKTIPLVVLSLGIAVAFRMKFWNIGAEGQFYLGAFGATLAASCFPGSYSSAPCSSSRFFRRHVGSASRRPASPCRERNVTTLLNCRR